MAYILKENMARKLKEFNKDIYEHIVQKLETNDVDDESYSNFIRVEADLCLGEGAWMDSKIMLPNCFCEKCESLKENTWYDYSTLTKYQREQLEDRDVVVKYYIHGEEINGEKMEVLHVVVADMDRSIKDTNNYWYFINSIMLLSE